MLTIYLEPLQGLLEMANASGQIIGPAIGAGIYSVGCYIRHLHAHIEMYSFCACLELICDNVSTLGFNDCSF